MKAYLDSNIFAAIDKGDYTHNELLSRIDDTITEIPFSAAHIHETVNITSSKDTLRSILIEKRLATIRSVTGSLYIEHEYPTNIVRGLIRDPETVMQTIGEVQFADTMIRRVTRIVPQFMRQQVRDSIGLSPKQLNNYKPAEVIEHLNKKITKWGIDLTIMSMIEKTISFFPDKTGFGFHNNVTALVEILDVLGYWTDDYSENSNYGRLWDSFHIHDAAHCDYLISDDKKLRNKARVVYITYGIDTRVFSSKGEETV